MNEAWEQARIVYPIDGPHRGTYVAGALAAFRGEAIRACPYSEKANSYRRAWLAGFEWARELNSVMIGV